VRAAGVVERGGDLALFSSTTASSLLKRLVGPSPMFEKLSAPVHLATQFIELLQHGAQLAVGRVCRRRLLEETARRVAVFDGDVVLAQEIAQGDGGDAVVRDLA
jgi:hypothetical protein